jgi:hypothetical protein
MTTAVTHISREIKVTSGLNFNKKIDKNQIKYEIPINALPISLVPVFTSSFEKQVGQTTSK